MRSFVSNLFRKVPAVARRDRQIARLTSGQEKHRREIAALREQAKQARRQATELKQRLALSDKRLQSTRELAQRAHYPTFEVMLTYYRAYIRHAKSLGAGDAEPVLQIPRKLRNISLAQSHGISVPRIYQAWESINSIDLEGLPDEFVLKADGGTSGHAVFPLRRDGSGFQIIGGDGSTLTEANVKRAVELLGGRARRPFFAEEYLPPNDLQYPVPDDVKVYVFYGEPAQVLLMRVPNIANRGKAVRKYLDPFTGASLGKVLRGVAIDSDIPTPPHLPEIVQAARHLSRASGVSFCRIDFFDTPAGPVFGEITTAPGGRQRYEYDHAAGMADEWLKAQIRLHMDEAGGRPAGALWGPNPYDWHYSDRPDPRDVNFGAGHVISCEEWCV